MSASEDTSRSAAEKSSPVVIGPGTATTAMPAATAAATPLGESSSATQAPGAAPRRSAASRYRSGAGLVRDRSPSRSSRLTTSAKRSRSRKRSRWPTTHDAGDDDTTAAGGGRGDRPDGGHDRGDRPVADRPQEVGHRRRRGERHDLRARQGLGLV